MSTVPETGNLTDASAPAPTGGRRAVLDLPREVVQRAQGGDGGAFAALYAHYHGPIRDYLHRLFGDPHDAEEFAQDTFLKAYRALPATSADLTVGAWLYRIATNVALDAFRHRALVRWEPFDRAFASVQGRGRRRGAGEGGSGPRGPWTAWAHPHGGKLVDRDRCQNPEPAALDRELAAHVRAVLDALPPRNRICLELRVCHDLTYVEIGEILGATRASVKSLLFRSRAEFRRIWAARETRERAHAA
jgi:RNA polymerase sigma-70 factor (ECF subfamily)